MKKIIVLPVLALFVAALFLIPVSEKISVPVKGPFLNIYTILSNPEKWEQWMPSLRQQDASSSGKSVIKKDTSSFSITDPKAELKVVKTGMTFSVQELKPKESTYAYTILPSQLPNKTFLVVNYKTNLFQYLFGQSAESAKKTHIYDFKNFMETDSLLYGCKIFKTRVPEGNLIVIRKAVPVKAKFNEAHAMLSTLQQYVKEHHLTQMQPVIAQFLPKGKDSAQVNVGLFIDKEAVSAAPVTFVRMPKGGPLYAARFTGSFNQRKKVYDGLQQYFTDHLYQSAILPFETYLNNKLPTADTSKISIQVNFTTYF